VADDEAERGTTGSALRSLPSVSALLGDREIQGAARLSSGALASYLRDALDRERDAILRGVPRPEADLRSRLIADLNRIDRARLEKALNATGVIIHTNLGRAPVSRAAADAMRESAANPVALEIDPDTGRRGGRLAEICRVMRILTGAEATVVVNNNAAALLLVLASLAVDREVVLSRGEAVEIGGGFRIPDVLRQSGARLVEVGTTNRTYPNDYLDAVTADTAAILKVHPSNFVVSGFTHSASVAELAPIARAHGLALIEDLGSGALLETANFGLNAEPTIQQSLLAGATVVTASGDKLLGGPQAGLICGAADMLERIERHPLARALRADKACLAGLAATLRHYARGEAIEEIPVWRQIAATVEQLKARGQRIQAELAKRGVTCAIVESRSTVGGGSLPGETLPSVALVVGPSGNGGTATTADEIARRLRVGRPSVFGRIDSNRVLLDLRTVLAEDDEVLVRAIVAAMTDPTSVDQRAGYDEARPVRESRK
jgi:L-seryl-tRNA(Ser) seleniumtransferase